MNKNESKYFNTAVRMDEALITLLEKKDFEYITVKEICETAQVNRSTFYLHYENTADLLTETLDYINNKFMEYFTMDAEATIQKIHNGTLEEIIFITPEYLIPYLNFVEENRRVFTAAIKKPEVYHSNAKFNSLYHHLFEPILNRFALPKDVQKYTLSFYIQGIMGIITEWINGGCVDDANHLSKLITNLILSEKTF